MIIIRATMGSNLTSRSALAGGGNWKWDVYAKARMTLAYQELDHYYDSLSTASTQQFDSLASMDGKVGKKRRFVMTVLDIETESDYGP